MKTIVTIGLLLLGVTAHAQYRFNRYEVYSSGTNGFIRAGTNSQTINKSHAVTGGSTVQLFGYYSLCSTNTNAVPSSATNLVTTFWDVSYDGERFTNGFTWAIRARATNEAWDRFKTNFDWPYIRFRYLTNENPAALTNFYFEVGQPLGF